MKYYILFFFLFAAYAPIFAQGLTPGEKAPPLSFAFLGEDPTANQPETHTGKVLLLDFWATWCAPCISSMSHLDSLQEAFREELRVIAVSEESEDRLLRFLRHTDHQFLFARDTGDLRELFPYGVIPHSVLIAPDGTVVAITSPDNITREVIEKTLRGEVVDLPVKRYARDFDPTHDYFQLDTNTVRTFTLQPHNPVTPSFTKQFYDGPFRGRRMSVYNLTIPGLYRMAYETTIYRMELEFEEFLVDWEREENRFCADVVVENPEDLLPEFRRHLQQAHPIKARTERQTREVVVLRAIKDGTLAAVPATPVEGYTGRQDGFSSEGATVEDFRSYLEGFGIFNLPVVDETSIAGAYAIDFTYDPENPTTFKTAMEELGLTYAKEEREIEVLILYLEE
ncbi:redoxin family protein [Lewinella sp. W8]|uniref:redoxin family protein n=1 Tax=Lewinella sp. W8 TaxID=2528208 RepID=UPI0010678979|nr:redoxin family protein [Lewinella sp. W8]MTB52107.1 redoxin family protein [Lewinella sp. W8]